MQAYAFRVMEDKHEQKRHSRTRHGKNGRNDVGMKEKNANDIGMSTQGPEYHPLVPSQYKKGGSTFKIFRGRGLVVGGKESILDFQL